MKPLFDRARNIPLVLLIPLALTFSLAALNFAYMVNKQPVTLVGLIEKFGYDFNDFRWASRLLLEGKDPYTRERFVTPPISAYLALPFVKGNLNRAALGFFWANIFALLGGLIFTYKTFDLKEHRGITALSLFFSALLSAQTFFLLHRGNIDGFVFLCLAAGVYAATRNPSWINDAGAGVAFALAAHLKIYPLLIFLPLIATRRWRLAGSVTFFLATFTLLTWQLWSGFIERITLRQNVFVLTENASLESTLKFAALFIDQHSAWDAFTLDNRVYVFAGYALYAAALLAVWGIHLRAGKDVPTEKLPPLLLMYIPFMLAVPSTAFHYELVNLFLLLPLIIWMQASNNVPLLHVAFLTSGILLSQFYGGALTQLTGSIFWYALPGIGLFIIVLQMPALARQVNWKSP